VPRMGSAPVTRRTALAAAAAAGVLAASVVACDDGHSSVEHMVPPNVAWVACSRLMVVGNVETVHQATSDGHVAITLTVQDWLKPSHGDTSLTLKVVDPAAYGDPRLMPGDQVLTTVDEETAFARTYGAEEVPHLVETVEKVLPIVPDECPPDEDVRQDV
jgi:hypothetical protein